MKSNINEDYIFGERMRIGAIIKERREDRGLTTRELAEEMGITYTTVNKIENGKFNFGIDTLTTFSVALNFKLELK